MLTENGSFPGCDIIFVLIVSPYAQIEALTKNALLVCLLDRGNLKPKKLEIGTAAG